MFLKNFNHHAILVEGKPSLFFDMIKGELVGDGIVIANNPDIIFLSFEKFGIAESRQIIEISNGLPVQENKRKIIFCFDSITIEAQNALLKVFEDPSPHTEFIFCTHTSDGLLPTLRSRLLIVESKFSPNDDFVQIDAFLKMNVGEKMQVVEKMIKEYKDSGNKFSIKNFILKLHDKLEAMILEDNTVHNRNALNATETALVYVDDKSASMKILLESVILAL